MRKIGIVIILALLLSAAALGGCESVKKPTVRQLMQAPSTEVSVSV
ncbi:MAG: hypothetical protein LBC56_01130 [Oscillospiraceae bacterium]|jgi:hypothetical protein|nr:hypothetical protein [Oscillospiraceae bacterium]